MTEQHPITPPPELVQQWIDANRTWLRGIALEAAQWGADQELEACGEWLRARGVTLQIIEQLRAARRPKPPSLKEQALEHLEQIHANAYSMGMGFDPFIIRRALESINE